MVRRIAGMLSAISVRIRFTFFTTRILPTCNSTQRKFQQGNLRGKPKNASVNYRMQSDDAASRGQ